MAKKNDAKRAAKKHAKEKKRQKKLAARPRAGAEVDVLARWKPATHGIEGLARLLRTDSHDAAVLAGHMAKGGRKDAKAAWIPARVQALSDEALLAELAQRGVVTDEAAFVALAEGYESSRKLAVEKWAPSLAEGASVHDRDLVGEAAEVLWERWVPSRLTDEVLRDRARDAQDADDATRVDEVCDVLDTVLAQGGPARLTRAGLSLSELLTAARDSLEGYPSTRARAERTFTAVRDACVVGDAEWIDATLELAYLLEARDDRAAIDVLLAASAVHPSVAAFVDGAAEIASWSADIPPDLHDRIVGAYKAGMAVTDGQTRLELEQGLRWFVSGSGDEELASEGVPATT